jgi:DNA-binding LacI/PurR family transcriptional regulator
MEMSKSWTEEGGMSGRPRTPTMADVAAAAGVSRALVSIVFRDQPGASAATRGRVRAAADQLGYAPDHRARLLSRSRTRLIGVVFGLHHEFHGEVVEALYAAAAPRGYEIALGGTAPGRDETTAVTSLLSYRCDALVLVGSAMTGAALADLAARVPLVVLARKVAGTTGDVVRTDDVGGGLLATRHLLDLGHRDIAHVGGGRASGGRERRAGYQRALRAADSALGPRLVTGGLTEAEGARAAESILAEHRAGTRALPTGVVAFNDRCALGLVTALRSDGVDVPGDLSVVGYDDSRVARLPWVDLTTIRQDTSVLAAEAVRLAVDRIEAPGPPRDVVVAPELIVRGSTASPRPQSG